MVEGLQLVLQRIERAKEQRSDLEREMRRWTEKGAYGVGTHLDPDTGNTLFYIGELHEVTPLIQALIAETIHSLRAALDNLAFQLFLLCRTDPSNEGDRVNFPIYDDSKPPKTDPFREIKAFGRPEILKMFEKINPCKSGNLLLRQLHRLDITDKHRRVITSFSTHNSLYTGDVQKQFFIDAGLEAFIPFVRKRQAFMTSPRTGKRAKVGDVIFVGFPGDEEMNKHLKFTFDISFDEPGIIQGEPVIKTIDEMFVLVQGIISSFEPLLI